MLSATGRQAGINGNYSLGLVKWKHYLVGRKARRRHFVLEVIPTMYVSSLTGADDGFGCGLKRLLTSRDG
jgi:hypothetical protein